MASTQLGCNSVRFWRADQIAQKSPSPTVYQRSQHSPQKRQKKLRLTATSILEAQPTTEEQPQHYVWQGDDEFTNLNDRWHH